MDNKMMVLIKKYLIIIIGQVIIGMGCAFMVTSGQGNDPMGVMISGFSQMFNIPFGTMTNIVSFIIFVFMLIFYRKRLTFTTIITVFAIGWTIDPVCALLNVVNAPELVVSSSASVLHSICVLILAQVFLTTLF